MGNSLGPILANIFMTHLEETHILNSPLCPEFYRRYVDDTFCLFKSREDVEQFHNFINTLHPSIKFDIEVEDNDQLGFLDTVVKRSPDTPSPSISTKVKQTDKGLFYNFDSFIPVRYKLNLIGTLIYRLYMIASNMTIFHVDLMGLRGRLMRNGFPSHLIDKCVQSVLNKHHVNQGVDNAVPTVSKRKVVIALPYLGNISIILRRNLTRLVHKFYPAVELRVVYRRGFRVSHLFTFKDKFPLACQSMCVYYICCRKCGPSEAYIGKTVNTVYERFHASGTGHLNETNSDSALIKHLLESDDSECSFKFDDIKILETGRYDEQIRLIESILLKYDKQNLNTCERSIKLNIV